VALETFLSVLESLRAETIQQMTPIACGVLDITGIDGIWSEMLRQNKVVELLGQKPVTYLSIQIHTSYIDTMCEELVRKFISLGSGNPVRVRPVEIPADAWHESDEVLGEVQAVHRLLENL